jgi:gluconokinase
LAKLLDFPYVEGDEIHPISNVAKMSSGIPLTDEDREPWLALIRKTAEEKTIRKRIDEQCSEWSAW